MAKQTKKTPTKKTLTKKTNKTAPVMEHKCSCGADCPCHKHGAAHVVRHIIVWAIIFALGMACGKMMKRMHPVFTNGCLDMRSVNCPKMAEDIAKADINGDGCISVEEYRVFKQANKKFHKRMHGFRK